MILSPADWDEFIKQEQVIMNWMKNANSEEERRFGGDMLQSLHKLRSQAMLADEPAQTIPKPIRIPLTKKQKFDKKNSRREAIMAQRERNANA